MHTRHEKRISVEQYIWVIGSRIFLHQSKVTTPTKNDGVALAAVTVHSDKTQYGVILNETRVLTAKMY